MLTHLPKRYKKYTIKPTKNGVSQSVYYISDKYIVKVLPSLYNIKAELKLLNLVNNIPISYIEEYIYHQDKIYIIYNQIKGTSKIYTQNYHIKQISMFLKRFHTKTKNQTSSNTMIFTKSYLENMIKHTSHIYLLEKLKNITITLSNDGIIHGDLFYDNAKFYHHKLSGVFDFSESCCGDFYFDLAVVAISWCFDRYILNKQKVLILLQTYQKNSTSKISYVEFKEYIKFALIYYTTLRILNKKDYKILSNMLTKL